MKDKEIVQEKIPQNGIRKATPEDAFAIAKINYDARQHNYKDIIAQDTLDHMNLEKNIERMKEGLAKGESVIYVKEIDGKIVGFVDGGAPRDENPQYESEIYAFYVDPSMQRQGVGKELMHVIMNDSFFKEKTSLYLRTLEQNPKSRFFYKKLGGKEFGTKQHTIGNRQYTLVGYYRQK